MNNDQPKSILPYRSQKDRDESDIRARLNLIDKWLVLAIVVLMSCVGAIALVFAKLTR